MSLWIIGGDFNKIRSLEDVIGSGVYNPPGVIEFIQAINLAQLS